MIDFELSIKNEGYKFIVGIDEAGRGPLAGPVVAGAVIVKDYEFDSKIADSKKISPKQREKAFIEILEKCYVGVGIISEAVIDRANILEATFMAMNNAVLHLSHVISSQVDSPEEFYKQACLLVDGNMFKTELPVPYKTITKGDSKAFSIACASIVAKVIRDRMLLNYDQIFPEYGFRQHKGYPTANHKKAIVEHGISLIHRKSFIHL